MNRVLICAGGKGARMKAENNIPKQFLKINDKYIIIHTLEKFERCQDGYNNIKIYDSKFLSGKMTIIANK